MAIKNELNDEQIDILKSSASTVAGSYFFRNNGSNGQIIEGKAMGFSSGSATTLFPDSDSNKVMIRVDSDKSGNQPLFVIDGKVVENGKNKLNDLDPKNIESVSVLKDKSATEVYGPEGKTE